MPFHTLGRTLARQFNSQPSTEGTLLTARVVYIAGEMLGRLWPAEQAAYVKVASFRDGKLVFQAAAGAAAQALKFQAPKLQNSINRELGAKVVREIEVRQG